MSFSPTREQIWIPQTNSPPSQRKSLVQLHNCCQKPDGLILTNVGSPNSQLLALADNGGPLKGGARSCYVVLSSNVSRISTYMLPNADIPTFLTDLQGSDLFICSTPPCLAEIPQVNDDFNRNCRTMDQEAKITLSICFNGFNFKCFNEGIFSIFI